MKTNFDIILLDEAQNFIMRQPLKMRKKIVFVLEKVRRVNDNRSFKKLKASLWEFRIRTANSQLRLLSFWDRSENTLVVCSHGFVKKTKKTPTNEMLKAERIRREYFKAKAWKKQA